MSQNDPVDIRILQLLRRDFTGKSTRRLGECVLGGDFGWAVEFGLDFEEVECGRGDDDLVGAVEFGLVDRAHNLLDGREGAVHLEVSAGFKSQYTARVGLHTSRVEELTRQRIFEAWWIYIF